MENTQKSQEEVIEEIDYDQLLSSAGKFGRYQTFLFLSTFPFYIFGVFSYFSQIFMTEVSPNHWCWIPELENLTVLERRALAIPNDEKARFGYSQCSAYVANWTDVLMTGQKPDSTWSTVPCQSGWEFNKTEIPYPTISSEMEWVCEKNSYQATAQSFFSFGSIVGGLIVGWISDRYGRIPALVTSNLIGCVAGVASAFSRSFIQFTVFRFFMGMSYDNCMMMSYLVVLEYVAPQYRTLLANLPFAIFFSFGATTLPWIALACGDWKIFCLATSVPFALAVAAPFIIPESPRWLLSKGRVDEAVEKVVKIGKINKSEVPAKLIKQFKQYVTNSNRQPDGSIYDMLKRPLLRQIFLCICLEYLCCNLIFDSLLRTINQLEFDFFISFTVVSFTEFPSIVLISFILDYTGRKFLMFVALLWCGVFSFLTPFAGGLSGVMCAVMARFAVNMCCNATMQWAAEMMPTSVRGSGTSIIHMSSYIGTVISPFIAYLEVYVSWLPLVVVGAVAVFASFLALTMPETARKEMPQTFEDAEILAMNQKLFEIPCLTKTSEDTKTVGQTNCSFQMK